MKEWILVAAVLVLFVVGYFLIAKLDVFMAGYRFRKKRRKPVKKHKR